MSQDMMFMQQIAMRALLGADFCFPATVLKFDEAKNEADIQPLFMRKEAGQEPEVPTIIEGVPVAYQKYKIHNGNAISVFIPGNMENHGQITFLENVECRPHLERGMVVQCVVNQRSMDDAEGGKPYPPGKSRVLNQHDAVIVGVLY